MMWYDPVTIGSKSSNTSSDLLYEFAGYVWMMVFSFSDCSVCYR